MPYNETAGQRFLDLSLEGKPRRLAYSSDESERTEIYVRSHPGGFTLWAPAGIIDESGPHPRHALGPYEIVSAIGAGGMGEVYKARDTRLDLVAIKGAADGVRPGSRSPRAVRARRQSRRGAVASEHPVDLRRGHARRPRVCGDGAARRRVVARASGPRSALRPKGDRLRHSGDPRSRGCARQRSRPSRSETRQHLPARRRAREDSGLRPRANGVGP